MALRFRATAGEEYTRVTNLPASMLDFSCVLIVRPWQRLAGRTIVSLAQDASNYLSIAAGTQVLGLSVRVGGATQNAVIQGITPFQGAWLHLAVVRNGTLGTAFVRPVMGGPIRRGVNTGLPAGDFVPDALSIGSHSEFASSQPDMDVAYVRMWTAALTFAEIVREFDLSSWTLGGTAAGLHAAYPLKGDAVLDYGPNGYTLTAGTAHGAVDPTPALRLRRAVGSAAAPPVVGDEEVRMVLGEGARPSDGSMLGEVWG